MGGKDEMIGVLILALAITLLVFSAVDDIPDFVTNPPPEKTELKEDSD